MAEVKKTTRRKATKTVEKQPTKTPTKQVKKTATKKTVTKQAEKQPKDRTISTKKARITREINRLKKLFTDIDENKKKLAYATIKDVAFMTVTMEDLREEIALTGTVEEYKNGPNQYGKKQSIAVQNYIQFSSKQTAAMKILMDALPKSEPKKPESDGFDDFVYSRDEI